MGIILQDELSLEKALTELKNLSRKEIPACFFKSIDHEKPTNDWYYEDFAALVEVAKKDGKL